jgi:peptidoglycan/LPS O-acetylase OafA/YrhL
LAAWALAIASGTFWLAWLGGLVQPGRMESLLLLRHGCYFGLGMALMKAGAGPFGWRQGALVALCCATAWVEISALLDAEFPPDRDAFPVIVPFSAWLGAVGLIWLSVRWKMQAAHALARQGRWLAHAVRWLGLATYPLYLIHVQPGVLVMRLVMDRGVAASPAAWIAAAACTALALLIAIVFEPRVRRPVRKVAESLLLHMPQRRWRPANSG